MSIKVVFRVSLTFSREHTCNTFLKIICKMADLVKYCEICFRERKEYCEKNNSYRFSTDRTGGQF